MGIQHLIQSRRGTLSLRELADRVRTLGHTAPGESTIEHWAAGRQIKRLPAREAILGIADALNVEPHVVRDALLEDIGVLGKRGDAQLITLLPTRIDALDDRPDLLEAIIGFVEMAVEKAIREDKAATQRATPRKTPAKTPPKTTTKPTRATPATGTAKPSPRRTPPKTTLSPTSPKPQRRRTNG